MFSIRSEGGNGTERERERKVTGQLRIYRLNHLAVSHQDMRHSGHEQGEGVSLL